MDSLTRLHITLTTRVHDLLEQPERGDGPVDNAWIIAGMVAAAGIIVTAVGAAVNSRVGGIR